MGDVKRATVYFDTHIHRALRIKAAEMGTTLSALVNEAVRRTLEDPGGESGEQPRSRLKLDWAGGLREYRDKYTSLELQKKALEWWGD